MSYKINFTNTTKQSITVDDLSLNNTDTSLVFVGKNYPGYAQFIGENFLHLLENFASSSEPANPIEGQLWYDTSTSQLKVRDSGSRWIEASGIKKSALAPAIANPGDLWVNSTTQQLYLYNASNQWVLIGPQFNETSSTGFKAEEIIDRATNTGKFVVSVFVDNRRVAIFSTQEFSPKLSISGFSIIRQGITLSSEDFDNDGLKRNKYWGTAEKADALVVGNTTIPAANFLRSDVASTSSFPLNVRSATGVSIGESLETTLSSSAAGAILSQKTGGSIFLNTTSSTTGTTSVVTVTADKKVGVNNLLPTTELDVIGNAQISGNTQTANLTVTGTASINKVNLTGLSTSAEKFTFGPQNYIAAVKTIVEPGTTDKFNLGSSTKKFNTIYSSNAEIDTLKVNNINLIGGTIAGNITGSAGSLATSASFSMSGDLTSNTVAYNGTNQTVTFTSSINSSFVSNKPRKSKADPNDRFLIFQPTSPSLNIGSSGDYFQISQADLFASFSGVPVGSIVAYAGDKPPQDYLFCDGSTVSRALYAKLFGVIGTRYGAGNGTSTFALPDLRGRFGAGFEGMNNSAYYPGVTATPMTTRNPGASTLTNVGGEYQRTITEAQMPQHGHLFDDIRFAEVWNNPTYSYNDPMLGPISVGPGAGSNYGVDYDNGVYFTKHGTYKTGSSQPMNIMNPFLTINYIIYTGGAV